MGWHVGVIGSGPWSRVHLQALTQSDHVDRVTLASRNISTAADIATAFPIVEQVESDYRELLRDPSIELVHILLPHHLHAEVAQEFLSAGKHVICEKPAAICLDDFDQLVATAEANDRRLFVVMNQLYNPLVAKVRELLDRGAIGRPFLLVESGFSEHAHFYRDAASWRTRIDLSGGGVLIDGGFHMIYKQLHFLAGTGQPQWVIADAAQLNVDPSGKRIENVGEDFVSYTVGYDGPLRIASAHAWTLATDVERPRQGFIAGSEATLELPAASDEPLILRRDNQPGEKIQVDPGPQSGAETTVVCLLDFLDCLAQDRSPVRANLAAARETLAVILAAYASAFSGNRIAL